MFLFLYHYLIRTKTDNFRINLCALDADAFCLTETWLNDNFSDSEVCVEGFLIYRRDRNYSVINSDMGGGCLIGVRNSLKSSRQLQYETNLGHLEDIWIKLELVNGRSLFICTTYISPPSEKIPYALVCQYYQDHFNKVRDNILTMDAGATILIVGDYNCPNINWALTPDNYLKPLAHVGLGPSELVHTLCFSNLYQFNGIRNANNNILDLVLSNAEFNTIRVTEAHTALVPEDASHPSINIDLNVSMKHLKERNHRIFNFRKANYGQINERIGGMDWNFLHELSCDNAFDRFYDELNKLISEFVPLVRPKAVYPPWYSMSLINLLKLKRKAHSKFKKTRMSSDYNNFKELRIKCKIEIEKSYRTFLDDIQVSTPNNIKKFWSYTKLLRQSNSFPSSFTNGVQSADSPNSICNIFADYFKSTYSSNTDPLSSIPSRTSLPCSNAISSFSFSDSEIESLLSTVDINKNGGPDGIPNFFLKHTASSLSRPITILMNKSMSEGICPTIWKKSFITPILKKGDKSLVSNYRPISILNSLSKILEKLIHQRLFLAFKGLLAKEQHGFFKGRSTLTNLLEYTNFIARSMDEGDEIHAIYTDFCKAFDRVDINILLSKLRSFGIRGKLLDWFGSYLKGRVMYVAFNGSSSYEFSPTSGVPQGSILGPLLFSIFINDLCSVLKCLKLLFADDMKLYARVRSILDCARIQTDLNRLRDWCSANKLDLNTSKCFAISFTNKINRLNWTYRIGTTSIQKVDEIRDLGVIFDSRLKFDRHIDHVMKKANRNLGFVMRVCKDFTNVNCMKSLYSAIVRSQLEYASQIWRPYLSSYIIRIEKNQRKFTRFLSFKEGISGLDYNQRLNRFKMMSLENRRRRFDMSLFYKVVRNAVDCDVVHYLNLNVQRLVSRTPLTFRPPISRINVGLHMNPLIRLQREYNESFSHVDIFATTYTEFNAGIVASLGFWWDL